MGAWDVPNTTFQHLSHCDNSEKKKKKKRKGEGRGREAGKYKNTNADKNGLEEKKQRPHNTSLQRGSK